MGLHSGFVVTMIVTPAAPNTGYTFIRRDVNAPHNLIKAHWHNVYDAAVGTNLRNAKGVKVLSVEHLLAALAAHGIDNARILIDGPEVPSMDGSARAFSELIHGVGKLEQNAPRKVVLVKKIVQVCEGNRFLDVLPSPLLWVDLETYVPNPKLDSERLSTQVTELTFIQKLSDARNLVSQEHIKAYRELGYFQGANHNNLLVHQYNQILNRDRQRYKDESARHNIIDLLGDLSLAGAPVVGHFIGRGTNHSLHHLLMMELMCDPDNFAIVTMKDLHENLLDHSATITPSRNTAY
jgi:UDP-3-O-[3-hydroxymyristoyl] N-acetylglucosamine deacetylase